MSEQIGALESEKKKNLVDPNNPNSIQKSEMNRESPQVTATASLVLFRIVAMAFLDAAAVAGLPE
jgi:hypothetical protein